MGLFDRKKPVGDALDTEETGATSLGFPWTYGEPGQRPIGTLFPEKIDDATLEDFYQRYQLGRRIIDDPVEHAISNGFVVKIGGQESKKAQELWTEHKTKWLRFFKLVRLYGHSEMMFGWVDWQEGRQNWNQEVPDGVNYTWLQPVPKDYEQELKETETIPRKIQYLIVNFGKSNIQLHPSRFIHAMNPKLIEEDKQGESALLPVADLLQVQIHADWSIGQALWRRAGGLLGLYGPKRSVKDDEKQSAINSVANYNSKTVVYIPFGWQIKEILKTSGNIAIQRTYRVILEQISAGSGIPISILIGQQKSALSMSEEDKDTYNRLLSSLQENTMGPTLKKWYRLTQKAGMLEAGAIEIIWEDFETKSPLQKERDMTEIGALRVLQARMEDATENPEAFPVADLVKVLSKRK